MTEFPSQHREALDHIYSVLSDKATGPRRLKDASQLAPKQLAWVLDTAVRSGLVTVEVSEKPSDKGGRRYRRGKCTRTAFRDAFVLQWFSDNVPITNKNAVWALTGLMSKSQLYYSVARLRAADELSTARDGTRTPVYNVVQKEVAA